SARAHQILRSGRKATEVGVSRLTPSRAPESIFRQRGSVRSTDQVPLSYSALPRPHQKPGRALLPCRGRRRKADHPPADACPPTNRGCSRDGFPPAPFAGPNSGYSASGSLGRFSETGSRRRIAWLHAVGAVASPATAGCAACCSNLAMYFLNSTAHFSDGLAPTPIQYLTRSGFNCTRASVSLISGS